MNLKKSLFNFEMFFSVIVLLILSLPEFTVGASLLKSFINLAIMLFSIILIGQSKNKMFNVFHSDKILAFLILFVAISISWSVTFLISLHFLIKFLTIIFFSIFIISRFNQQDIIKIIASFISISTIASCILSLAFPSYFTHAGIYHAGNWMGIFGHKNSLGTFSVIGLMFYIWNYKMLKKKKLALISILLLFVLLFKSASATAFAMIFIILLSMLIFKIYKLIKSKSIYLLVSITSSSILLAGILFYFVSKNLNYIFFLLDRNPNLTGRTEIWAIIKPYIKEHLLLGYGYGGFWNTTDAIQVIMLNGFPLTSSHSGIYDLILDVGIIGLFIFFLHFVNNLRIALKLSTNKSYPLAGFTLIYLLFILINNIPDSRFLNSTSIYFTLYLILTLALRKTVLKNKA